MKDAGSPSSTQGDRKFTEITPLGKAMCTHDEEV